MNNRAVEILLVDDDTAVRVISTRILSKAGLVVEAVADGEAALDLLRRGRRFDVIVSDLVMPNMDGMELLRRVRELDLDVPVIVVTGQGTLESAIMAMEYGGFRYLQKPVENAPDSLKGGVPIVLTTHAVAESVLKAAIERIAGLPSVLDRPRLLRIARI